MQNGSRIQLLGKFISTIPAVKSELVKWATLAEKLPEPLRTQALLSIEHKTFHCIGGSIYAHYPGVDRDLMLQVIVAFQTISDYLDNLCDRLAINDPKAFRLLHQSFMEALSPGTPQSDYYTLYPQRETLYLPTLVQTCQTLLRQIPYYAEFQPQALHFAEYYCELQVLKHITPNGRDLLQQWVETKFDSALAWNEWAAACGSTLGIFLMMALGFQPPQFDVNVIINAYFPWIQGLHILLDYLIDLDEDEQFGDLNFVALYLSKANRDDSLRMFSQESKKQCNRLPFPYFHRTVVDGLLALYGSDPKVPRQQLKTLINQMTGDHATLFMLKLCNLLRRIHVL